MELPIRLLLFCCRCLPEALVQVLARLLGAILAGPWGFRSRLVRQHLQAALGQELPPAALERLRRGFYRHLGLLVWEYLRMPLRPPEYFRDRLILHGGEHLERAFAQGQGVILCCGHLGNWELALIGMRTHGFEGAAVVKEVKGRVGRIFLELVRARTGGPTIGRREGARAILKTLRQNHGVCFFLDQNMTADEGVFAPFFGRPACTQAGVPIIAQRSGAPVLPVQFYRDPDGIHHHAVVHPPLELPGDDVPGSVARLNQALEGFIREHPEQWIWMHKRWKTQPPPTVQEPPP